MALHIDLPRASLEANTLIPILKNAQERRRDRDDSIIWKGISAPESLHLNRDEIIGLERSIRILKRRVCRPLNRFRRDTLNGKAFLLVGVGTGKDYLVKQIFTQIHGVIFEISAYNLPDLGHTRRYQRFVKALFHQAAIAQLPTIVYFRDIDKIVNPETVPSIPQTWLGDLIRLCHYSRGIFIIASTENPEILTYPLLCRFHGMYHIPLPENGNDRIRIGRVMRRKYEVRDRRLRDYLYDPRNTTGWSVNDIETFVMLWARYQMEGIDLMHFFQVPTQLAWRQARIFLGGLWTKTGSVGSVIRDLALKKIEDFKHG